MFDFAVFVQQSDASLFQLHFLLISWSHLGGWAGLSLLFPDVLLLQCLLWAVHDRRSLHPGTNGEVKGQHLFCDESAALPDEIHLSPAVFLAMVLNVVSVLLDIVALSVRFPSGTVYGSTEKFSGVMAIFNLILRYCAWYIDIMAHGQ